MRFCPLPRARTKVTKLRRSTWITNLPPEDCFSGTAGLSTKSRSILPMETGTRFRSTSSSRRKKTITAPDYKIIAFDAATAQITIRVGAMPAAARVPRASRPPRPAPAGARECVRSAPAPRCSRSLARRAPQRAHCSISMPNTRLRRRAQFSPTCFRVGHSGVRLCTFAPRPAGVIAARSDRSCRAVESAGRPSIKD